MTTVGYNGLVLEAMILKYPKTEMVTEENSVERLALLSKANTCGKLFSVNDAGHLTSNDMFLAGEKNWRKKEKKRLTTEKNRRVRLMKIEEKAKGVSATKGDDGIRWIGTYFDAVLVWYNCPKQNRLANKEEKMNAWQQMKEKGLQEPAPCVCVCFWPPVLDGVL